MAFPTTSVLDTFNRANENPLATASGGDSWGNSTIGLQKLQVTSNTCVKVGNGNNSQRIGSYGPDMEAYVDLVTMAASDYFEVWLRVFGAAGDGGGYVVRATQAGATLFYRAFEASLTQLGASESVAWTNGDSLGADIVGSTLTGYRKSGSWASISTRSDGTHTAAGAAALVYNTTGSGGVMDNFGGGTVAGAAGNTYTETGSGVIG